MVFLWGRKEEAGIWGNRILLVRADTMAHRFEGMYPAKLPFYKSPWMTSCFLDVEYKPQPVSRQQALLERALLLERGFCYAQELAVGGYTTASP